MNIASRLRRQVVQRAKNCCEYCGLSQAGQEAAFHVDHVMPATAGGETALEIVIEQNVEDAIQSRIGGKNLRYGCAFALRPSFGFRVSSFGSHQQSQRPHVFPL
jgi:hypothetical protein